MERTKEALERAYWQEGLTMEQIGRILGVTKERVRQIMEKLGIPRRYPPRERTRFCPNCGAPLPTGKRYCSDKCKEEYRREKYWVKLKCNYCGREFWRREAWVRASTPERGYVTGAVYCSRDCAAKARRGTNLHLNGEEAKMIADLWDQLIPLAEKWCMRTGKWEVLEKVGKKVRALQEVEVRRIGIVEGR